MVLKLAELHAQAMIAGMLPYLQWKFAPDDSKKGHIAKWFTPAARARAMDTYWDPVEECVKNTSNKMLGVAMADEDDLYWEAKKPAPELTSPKQKQVQVEEESLDDTVSTIKPGLSTKKAHRAASKTSGTSTDKQEKKQKKTHQ